MTLKQVILHVGLHKTATSSFQVTCGTNRKQLLQQGIHYPRFEIDKRKISNHSVPVFSLFCAKPENYNVNIKWGYSRQIDRVNAAYRQQLDRAIDSHERILLSGEDISVLPPAALKKFKCYLTTRGCELRVLCGVRKPYSFVCSDLQQRIRAGILGDIQQARMPQQVGHVEKLKRIFESVEFFSFEADCLHPAGPVGALLERIGIDYKDIKQREQNEGLGNISTRLYAGINKSFPVLRDGALNPQGRARETSNFDDSKFLLTPEELSTMRAGIDEQNREFRRLLGEAFTDDAYPTSGPFTIDFTLARRILLGASKPAHVRPVVEDFLCRHGDSSWNSSDLARIRLPASAWKYAIANPEQGAKASPIERATRRVLATIRRKH